MASAQDIYLNSSAPYQAPTASGWEMMWNWATGNWDERNRQYRENVNLYNAQRALTAAEWEREDSAYQRLVKDMTAAGLNPYYALNQSSVSPYSSSGQSLADTKSSPNQKQ